MAKKEKAQLVQLGVPKRDRDGNLVEPPLTAREFGVTEGEDTIRIKFVPKRRLWLNERNEVIDRPPLSVIPKQAEESTDVEILDQKDKGFTCEHCGRRFGRGNAYKLHLRSCEVKAAAEQKPNEPEPEEVEAVEEEKESLSEENEDE